MHNPGPATGGCNTYVEDWRRRLAASTRGLWVGFRWSEALTDRFWAIVAWSWMGSGRVLPHERIVLVLPGVKLLQFVAPVRHPKYEPGSAKIQVDILKRSLRAWHL